MQVGITFAVKSDRTDLLGLETRPRLPLSPPRQGPVIKQIRITGQYACIGLANSGVWLANCEKAGGCDVGVVRGVPEAVDRVEPAT